MGSANSGEGTSVSLKVLHAPLNYANQAFVVSEALRKIGVDSTLLTYQRNKSASSFGFGAHRTVDISFGGWLVEELSVVRDALSEGYDVVHFWNRSLVYRHGDSFFNGMDIPLFKSAGRRMAYRFTGYELRRKSLELELNPYSPFRYGFESSYDEANQQRYLDFLRSTVDALVVQDPEMQTYAPEAIIVPRALELQNFAFAEAVPGDKPLIVHAPTDRLLKGSDFVEKAVAALKEKGLSFEFKLIQGMSHEEALQWYRRADIVVDQLLIGWYGVVAVEAMAMGKTVVAYIREDLLDYFGGEMPLLAANPDTIESVLQQAISDFELRRELGRRGRGFVERVHDSEAVAAKLRDAYVELLAKPQPARAPSLDYHLEMTSEINNLFHGQMRIKFLEKKKIEQQKEIARLQAQLEGASADGGKADAEIPSEREAGQGAPNPMRIRFLERKVKDLRAEIVSLRYKAEQYEKLKPELPQLRYRAKRYEELRRNPITLFKVWRASKGQAAVQSSATSTSTGYEICILSRKALRDITRVVRLAKALSDAGHRVTVVSLEAPIEELRKTTPTVQYIEAPVVPATTRRVAQINKQRAERRREFRGTTAEKVRAWAFRIFVKAPFLDLPSAILTRKKGEGFSVALKRFLTMDVFQLRVVYQHMLRQVAVTNGFADEAEKVLAGRHFDYVQAHDNYALVAAERIAKPRGAKIVYDAVEISEHRLATDFCLFEKFRERYERREEARIFKKAWRMITVSEGLADWYSKRYGVPRPLVVRNCRYYWPHKVDRRIRRDAKIPEGHRLLVWIGSAYPQQGLELIVDTMPFLPDDVHLAIVATALPRWQPFLEGLPQRAAAAGASHRVHVLPPRGPNDLVQYASGADIGVIPRPTELLNNYYSMPNKFLEMTMARLPIAVSQLKDMADTVNKYGIGAVFPSNDPKVVAETIAGMLEPETYARLRENVFKVAESFSWESESKPYVEMFGAPAAKAGQPAVEAAERPEPAQAGAA